MKKSKKKNPKRAKIVAIVLVVLALACFIGYGVYALVFEKGILFEKQEAIFLKGAKEYFASNALLLPKEGQTREVTLEKLLEKNYVPTLFSPKTDQVCDASSWVRVYKTMEGKYEYYTYLKCAKFQSKTDHTGPEIILNGDKEMILELGAKYVEPGVKEVKDQSGGTMSKDIVAIDSSAVNTSKIGSYKVTYVAYDKLLNQSKVTRTVHVRQKLTTVVTNATDASNAYKGKADSNYLQYSGILWRILKVNADGSVRVVTASDIANVSYAKDTSSFEKSNIKKWLNDYFYSYLQKPEKYLKQESQWCLDIVNDKNQLQPCQNITKAPVGLLSLEDLTLAQVEENNFLTGILGYWLVNAGPNNQAWMRDPLAKSKLVASTSLGAVRPVVNITKDSYIVAGDGSKANPYKLDDYEFAKEYDLLSSRIAGEYINYSGVLWRVMETDKQGNTKVVMASNLINPTDEGIGIRQISYKNDNEIKKFNPKEEGNIAQILNDEWTDYIDDKYIVSHEWSVPEYEVGQNYDQAKTTKVKAKIAIPNMYEIFSGSNRLTPTVGGKYYFLNASTQKNMVLFLNNVNGMAFHLNVNDYPKQGVKMVVYLDKGVKIASGKGTYNDPYFLKK